MKRKLFFMFLAVIILLLNLYPPRIAKADAIKVDGQVYNTLQEAVDAINNTGTITICKDIWEDKTVVIPNRKHITITDDGNARKINKSGWDNMKPLFMVEKGGELTMNATSDSNLTLRPDQHTGLMASVNNTGNNVHIKGTFNLKSGTIWCGSFAHKASTMGSVYVDKNSVFNMSGGIIKKMTADSWYVAPVFVSSGAAFNMSGGSIENNENEYNGVGSAGAVLLFVWNDNPIATMNMSGGKIANNKASNGGGVFMTGHTRFTMTGGSIENNNAKNGQGGGVCVAANSGVWVPDDTIFILDGGTIKNNVARNGGGVYVNSDGVHLKSGYIEGNKAMPTSSDSWSGHGGGVYISEYPRVLKVNNTIVTENIAMGNILEHSHGMGGGLWACPTGSIELKVTNGIAVFNNKAINANSAGDDVVNVRWDGSLIHGTLTLPGRMLGGGVVKWYKDGGILQGHVGESDPSVPRFDSSNPGDPVIVKNSASSNSLKAITSPEAIARAYEEATVFIRNNTASHGGGIGTNGDISMPNLNYPDWTLKIKKIWDDGIPKESQSEIEVFLKINGRTLDSVKLNQANDWKAEFKELPDPATLKGKTIDVIEGVSVVQSDGTTVVKETNQWQVTYDKIKNENYTIEINVKNNSIPLVPKTGDNTNIYLYLGIIAVVCTIFAAIIKNRKNNK